MRKIVICLHALLWLGLAVACQAHKPSDSYLTLRLEDGQQGEQHLEGRWDIALRDLEHALGLDADLDGAITWAELRARHGAIADYALARLNVSSGGHPCTTRATEQLVDRHSDGAYSVLRFALECATPPRDSERLEVDYALFFDLDPTHRGMLQVASTGGVRTAIFSPDAARIELDVTGGHPGTNAWHELVTYWREGVWHIWIGFDHILFLLTLLLGATAGRQRSAGDRVRESVGRPFRGVILDVAGIVTAFTVAHSITLAPAVLGWVSLPSRWVEATIAATVLLAAIHNVHPIIPGRRWVIAFVLGLIHGFGFAGVLVDLGLPAGALALALLGFNLGVETGQLAIVALFLPVAFWWRESWFYRRVVLTAGSLAIAAVAAFWLIERSFGS